MPPYLLCHFIWGEEYCFTVCIYSAILKLDSRKNFFASSSPLSIPNIKLSGQRPHCALQIFLLTVFSGVLGTPNGRQSLIWLFEINLR